MSMIRKVLNPPLVVKGYFEQHFPPSKGYTFKYYSYFKGGENSEKIYGCNVFKDDKLIHNATQARYEWFAVNQI